MECGRPGVASIERIRCRENSITEADLLAGIVAPIEKLFIRFIFLASFFIRRLSREMPERIFGVHRGRGRGGFLKPTPVP
jgi:hypothetical protein